MQRLVPSRSHELHESKFPFVSRIEFIRSKLSIFSAHVYGVVQRHNKGKRGARRCELQGAQRNLSVGAVSARIGQSSGTESTVNSKPFV